MIPEDVPAAGAAELRPTAGALAWRDAAFQHAEQPMAVPIASLTFTEEGDVTVRRALAESSGLRGARERHVAQRSCRQSGAP